MTNGNTFPRRACARVLLTTRGMQNPFELASGKFRLAPGTHDARSCAHKGSGAPKGAPSNAPRCIDKRCRLPGLRGSAPKMIRGALAFRRFAAALATTSQRRNSGPEPRFLGLGEAPGETHDPEKAYPGLDPGWKPASRKDHAQTMTGVLPALTCPSPVSSSQTGRRAGPAGPRSRPGAGCKPARGNRPRSAFGLAFLKAPLVERDGWTGNRFRDECQGWSPKRRRAGRLDLLHSTLPVGGDRQ